MDIQEWVALDAERKEARARLDAAVEKLKAMDEDNYVLSFLKESPKGSSISQEGDALVISMKGYFCACDWWHFFEDRIENPRRTACLLNALAHWGAKRLVIRVLNRAEKKVVHAYTWENRDRCMAFPRIPDVLEWEFIPDPATPSTGASPSP